MNELRNGVKNMEGGPGRNGVMNERRNGVKNMVPTN